MLYNSLHIQIEQNIILKIREHKKNMCGIVGYIGEKKTVDFLLDGLTKLEYRGYDSAGVAVMEDENIFVEKSVGRLDSLKEKLKNQTLNGVIGIGHTRWATHGRPRLSRKFCRRTQRHYRKLYAA